MYLGLLIIVSKTILDQNHLGGWPAPAAQTPGGRAQLSPLGENMGFLQITKIPYLRLRGITGRGPLESVLQVLTTHHVDSGPGWP